MSKKTSLTAVSLFELKNELAARERRAKVLHRRRAKLVAQIAALDAEAGMEIVVAGGVRLRAKNDKTLPDALAHLLDGKTLSVTDAANALLATGYKTHSATFTTMVNGALLDKRRFKRVAPGKYTAK